MPKPSKKGKGPRRSQDARGLDDSSLNQITAKIDQSLNSKDHKRKQPPTKTAGDQHQKRQRNSQGSGAEKGSSKIDSDVLLEEIKALGGDESDLALIKDIDSEDEIFAPTSKVPVDKSLKDELAAFSKQLGFAEVELSEASDQDEGGDSEDDVEDDDEDDEEDAEEEEVKEAPKPKEAAPLKIAGMVSQVRLFGASLTANAVN